MAVTPRSAVGNEDRLAAVASTRLLDGPRDAAFDRIAALAARVLNAPVVLIALLDRDREYFLSCVGLPAPWCTRRETPLSHSLGRYVVEAAAPYIVADASLEPALIDHGAVIDLGVVAYAGVPLELRDGQVIGTLAAIDSVPRAWNDSELAILEDLAALIMTEVSLRQSITAIDEMGQQKNDLMEAVSHNLKSPITAVRGHAQLLQRIAGRMDSPDREHLEDGLDRIENSARQMVQILDDFVDLTYLDMNRPLPIHLEPTDLAAIARHAAANRLVRGDSHPIRVEVPDELVCDVDGPRLQRALENLLTNAIKYSPDGGEIVLRLARLNRDGRPWVRIQVADQGVGIPAAELSKVFNRPSRGRNVGRVNRTGLGLAGVHQIVLQLGGSTEIESEEQHGTTVTVELPLQPEQ